MTSAAIRARVANAFSAAFLGSITCRPWKQ